MKDIIVKQENVVGSLLANGHGLRHVEANVKRVGGVEQHGSHVDNGSGGGDMRHYGYHELLSAGGIGDGGISHNENHVGSGHQSHQGEHAAAGQAGHPVGDEHGHGHHDEAGDGSRAEGGHGEEDRGPAVVVQHQQQAGGTRPVQGQQQHGHGHGHSHHNFSQGNVHQVLHGSGYSHVLSDPMIQESLSPFFQPFGIDVSRFPMTNPPIFQSALANYNAPPRRRRISISNGQIGQMGQLADDYDLIESIYDIQPPPMPLKRVMNANGKVQFKQPNYHESMPPHAVPATSFPHEFADAAQQAKPLDTQNGNVLSSVKEAPSDTPLTVPATHPSQSQSQQAPPPLSLPPLPQQQQEQRQRQHEPQEQGQQQQQNPNLRPVLPTAEYRIHTLDSPDHDNYKMQFSMMSQDVGSLPGTASWKRARLLERNRIAASKCRQRKKVAQQQLQKDVKSLTKENKVMRKKLDYYQKLVNKFKKFMELHMDSCGGNKDGIKVIEEMLKIDHDLDEDEDGTLVFTNSDEK